ncbi:class I SAM-dependent methyltransferase [Dietzia psychralcaliphila]|uniref:class I SAM-dependent methyltransferase n=1 Tax=Dietzia psychralcaliphila TaxID=139021 RepID=UPI000D44FF6C|nr:class I SAM-dependent methyltransferase [Dietzia psychralcaliphila]PTM87890.1 methyltransferase family protein [Dietzia psychralcaliphila]
MTGDVSAAYTRRAREYIDLLGSLATVHASDLELVTRWADQLGGPVIDAGCGPGHWTGHLAARGVDVRGVDRVPEFVDHARRSHPGCRFDIGDLDELTGPPGGAAGILAWYSLIHHEPSTVRWTLTRFARVLRPGGGLLLGFFHGAEVERFAHAVTDAYRWPIEALTHEVRMADFEVIETYTRTGPGARPHGAIVARLMSAHTRRPE